MAMTKEYETIEVKDERWHRPIPERTTYRMEVRRLSPSERVRADRCVTLLEDGSSHVLGARNSDGMTVTEALAYWKEVAPHEKIVGFAIIRNYDE